MSVTLKYTRVVGSEKLVGLMQGTHQLQGLMNYQMLLARAISCENMTEHVVMVDGGTCVLYA